MILEELTRLSSNLCNALSMISPRSFSSESTQDDHPERVHEDLEVKQAVQVLDKLISVAKQCHKALQPLIYRSDCKVFPESQALHNQQTRLDIIEPPSYPPTDFATTSPNSVVSCDDDSLASFQDSKQLLIQRRSWEDHVKHDGSAEEEEGSNFSKVLQSLEAQETARRKALLSRVVNLQSSNEEETLFHRQFDEAVKLSQIDNLQYSALEAETHVKDLEAHAAEQEDPMSKEVLKESRFQMTGFLQGSLEKLEFTDEFWYLTPSLTQLHICNIDYSKIDTTEELDHESLESEFWSPLATLQELDKCTPFFQTSLREAEYEASVEETELHYPSDLFEEIHTSDGMPREEPFKWEHHESLLLTHQQCGSSELETLEDTEIDLIPRTRRWKKQSNFVASGEVRTESMPYPWILSSPPRKLEFHDMGLTGLDSSNLGDVRASMEEAAPELQHNGASGGLKDLQVDDNACWTGSTVSEKAGIQVLVTEEVRKTLKENAREHIRELEVHDICCARQKILEAEFKPLMEELVVDLFAEFPSPSSSSDENSPPLEFSEDHQPMVNATTETTSCTPVNQATSEHSHAPILLPRSSSDTGTLEELLEQQYISLKTAIDPDSQHLSLQTLEEKPSSDKESSPVYTYPEMACDDSLDSDAPFKQPQQSSKVVTVRDIFQSSKMLTAWDFLESLKVVADRDSLQSSKKVQMLESPNSMNSIGDFKNSAELRNGSSDSEFVHEPLDHSELFNMQTLELAIVSKDTEEQQYHEPPNSMNSIGDLKNSAGLLDQSSDLEFVHEPLGDSELFKVQSLELAIVSKDPDDMALSELQNSRQMDPWEPFVEEDSTTSGALQLDFLFPNPHFKHEEGDKKGTMVLTHTVRVPETSTPHQKQLAAFSSQNQELVLSSRASKGRLRKLTDVTLDLARRSTRTVTFVDEAQTDDEHGYFPSLKSWEVQDNELQPISNEPQKHISKYKQQAEADRPQKLICSKPISSKHKHQAEADKFLVVHETPVPQSHSHRISTTKTSISSDCFPQSKTGIMMQHMISRSGRIFTHPRSLLLPFKGSSNKGKSPRIRPSNSSWVPPKETNFGGSARTDAEQIKRILRASQKTFAELTTSDFLSQELD